MRPLLTVVLCLAVTACGSSAEKNAAATATPSRQPAVVQVSMRHNRFSPERITLRVGQTVRWTNHDTVAHTVASQSLRLASEGIEGGQAYTYRARRPGRFPYYCTIHAGQTGVLVITRPR
jgi:plastocyanin